MAQLNRRDSEILFENLFFFLRVLVFYWNLYYIIWYVEVCQITFRCLPCQNAAIPRRSRPPCRLSSFRTPPEIADCSVCHKKISLQVVHKKIPSMEYTGCFYTGSNQRVISVKVLSDWTTSIQSEAVKNTLCETQNLQAFCFASEIEPGSKPGNPQVEKSNMTITWRRGRKVSKVTRASGPPLLFVDCTCEQVAWALSKVAPFLVMTAILIKMIMMFSLPASSRRPPSGSGQALLGPRPLGSPARCEDESSLRVAL